jgi:hypothetical protein
MAPVGSNPVVRLEYRIDYRPSGFDRVLTGEERSIPVHRIAQKPFIGRFLSCQFFGQVEFSLFPDELFSRELDASGEGDG